jgi:hypothetical protein
VQQLELHRVAEACYEVDENIKAAMREEQVEEEQIL